MVLRDDHTGDREFLPGRPGRPGRNRIRAQAQLDVEVDVEQHEEVEQEQQDEHEQDEDEAAMSISGSLISTISKVRAERSRTSVLSVMEVFLSRGVVGQLPQPVLVLVEQHDDVEQEQQDEQEQDDEHQPGAS